ncbi:MAG: DNA oxidative demethylase AlkB [Alphaproteobacteria bacterium]|nr:DNA oxidative demethylase AlkB [Alphaproteobacteria bacterium]
MRRCTTRTPAAAQGDTLDGIVPPARSPAIEGLAVLRGFALREAAALIAAITRVAAEAPFRHMITPGGFRMSVAMTNCGEAGWVTDRKGYRYQPTDPESGKPWPPIPAAFLGLAAAAAASSGFAGFRPDACLVNRYEPGTRLTLHQDRNERDFAQPIVSVSLGLPATFLFGGLERRDRPQRVPLVHGDVVVWGGPSRLNFHGVAELAEGEHPATGRLRYNLTLRKAL